MIVCLAQTLQLRQCDGVRVGDTDFQARHAEADQPRGPAAPRYRYDLLAAVGTGAAAGEDEGSPARSAEQRHNRSQSKPHVDLLWASFREGFDVSFGM